MTKDSDFVRALVADPANVELDSRRGAMVQYAVKLTRTPAAMNETDVVALRNAGLDDVAILHVNLICSYFAFVNRVADGLGVPLEDFWKDEPDP